MVVARLARVGAALLFAATLVACTAPGTSSSGNKAPRATVPNVAALDATLSSHCTDLPAQNLGEGTLCIDSGFKASRDGFSFANWGRSPQADQNVTIQTLIDLFGHNAVCMPGPADACVMRPRTIQALNEWNAALSGGRCEGLAALSVRMFLGVDTPTDFDPTASNVAALRKSSAALNRAVVYWWATQFLDEVSGPAASSRELTPLQLVDQLIQGLAHGTGYTLGLYTPTTGHAVTPFAVTKRGNNFVVHVYDNNFPNMRREVVVNGLNNTWTYKGAELSADEPVDWTGGTGTFELTPLAPRQGPFVCPFCNDLASGSDTSITYAPQDTTIGGTLHVDTAVGSITVTASAVNGLRITNAIPRADATLSKTGASGFVAIHLPSDITNVTIHVTSAINNQTPVSLVTIRRAGHSDIQVNGDLSSTHAIVLTEDGASLAAAGTGSTKVNVINGNKVSATTLANGDVMQVRTISSTEVEVNIKGKVAAWTTDSTAVSVEPALSIHPLSRRATPRVSTTIAGEAPSVEIVASD